MKIETKFFGPCEIEETEIIHFKHGIPGFEDCRRFFILRYKEDSPFFAMQSADLAEVALVLVELNRVVPNFAISLSDEDVVDLKLNKPEEAAIYAVIVIPEEITKATVNLAAPIIVNAISRLGKQIILDNSAAKLRHQLFSPDTLETEKKVAIK